MTTIHGIDGWQQVASFAVWALAVSGGSQLLFSEVMLGYLRSLLAWFSKDRTEEMRNAAARIQLLVGQETGQRAAVMSGEGEIGELQRRIQELGKASFFVRQLAYLVGCRFCQCVWAAVLAVVVFAPWVSTADFAATVLAYGVAAAMMPLGSCGQKAPCRGK